MDSVEQGKTNSTWQRHQELLQWHIGVSSLINIYKKLRQTSWHYFLAAVIFIYIILSLYGHYTTVPPVSIDGRQSSDKNSSRLHPPPARGPPYPSYVISITPKRFNFTRNNLETIVPNLFKIQMKQPVSYNDSRMYGGVDRNAASLMLTFIDLWNDIGALPDSEYSENDWIFIFEDDVNIVPYSIIEGFYPKLFPRWNFSNPNTSIAGVVRQGLQLAKDDGIIYLGTCGAEYNNNTQISYSYDGLFEFRRGAYFCTHAMGFTKWRARRMWGDLAVYKLSHGEVGSDTIARQWVIRSKTFPFSVATNIHWPPGTGHFGFFFQDRAAIPSTRG